jgi:hypothetical protein
VDSVATVGLSAIESGVMVSYNGCLTERITVMTNVIRAQSQPRCSALAKASARDCASSFTMALLR